jgi:hypothetical protein
MDLVSTIEGVSFSKNEEGKHNVQLTYDLETTGPDGSLIPQLSKEGMRTYNQNFDNPELPDPITFRDSLTVNTNFGTGEYTFTLTVHDEQSGQQATSTVTTTLE